MIRDDVLMRIRPLRLLTVVVVVLALALPAAGLAGPRRGPTVDRGVVQSVTGSQIVLRTLDGSTVSAQIVPRTRVRLNGRPASISDIAPGFVADLVADGQGRARVVRAFGTRPAAAPITERGVVIAVTPTAITLSTDTGTRSVALDQNTTFRVLGLPARRRVVRPGQLVAVTHAPGGPAQVVDVVKRAGA